MTPAQQFHSIGTWLDACEHRTIRSRRRRRLDAEVADRRKSTRLAAALLALLVVATGYALLVGAGLVAVHG